MPNPWLPRWGDPAVRYDRDWTWPTEAEILAAKLQPTLKGTMKYQRWYPSRISAQIPWLANFADKIAGYESVLTGVPTAHIDAAVASSRFLIYVYSQWLADVRAFGPACTEAVDLLTSGSGPTAVVLPVFTAPTLPEGVASVPPGVLNRLFDLVAMIKASPGYTKVIGLDLGIEVPDSSTQGEGEAAPDSAGPVVKGQAFLGEHGPAARLAFIKHGHMGVYIESRRGTGDWEFLAIETNSPYNDERPLLVAGQPEVREYRVRYWDRGTPNGPWCDIIRVTVGP